MSSKKSTDSQKEKVELLKKTINKTIIIISSQRVLGDAGFLSTVFTMGLMSITDFTSKESAISVNDNLKEAECTKTWVHGKYREPEEPRDKHLAIDGEKVDIEENFSIGYDPREATNPAQDYWCGCGVTMNYDGTITEVDEVFIRGQKDLNAGVTFKKIK